MPYYKSIFDKYNEQPDAQRRIGQNLLQLRRQLAKDLPPRNVQHSLLLATWNIREFGRNQKFGARIPESFSYIAEILSHFDLIAVQEVNRSLHDLQFVMRLLGSWWSYMVADTTEGSSGNSERMAFIYDTRKVRFNNIVGKLVLPPIKGEPSRQISRTPFLCSFKTGWRSFTLASAHMYWGTSKADDPGRLLDIDSTARLLAKRNQDRQANPDGEPDITILLGDFNIFSTDSEAFACLTKNKFTVPEPLMNLPSNAARDRTYDQIAFHDPNRRFKKALSAGVLDFQKSLFQEEDRAGYLEALRQYVPEKFAKATDEAKIVKLYRQWATFQVSDHLPLWVELPIDFSDNYIAKRAFHQAAAPGP